MGDRILIVDDEPSILKSLTRLLRVDGYQISSANSAAEGLEIVKNNEINVIISDQRMPEMEGSKFLSLVHKTQPQIVKIILSGYTDFHGLIEALNEGAIYKFVNKPWDGDELRNIVREAVQVYKQNSIAKVDENVAVRTIPEEPELQEFFSEIAIGANASYSSLALIESTSYIRDISDIFPVLRRWSHNKSAFPCMLSQSTAAIGIKGLKHPEEANHFFNDMLLEIENIRDVKLENLRHVNLGIGWVREGQDNFYDKLLLFSKSALEQQRKSSMRSTTRPQRDDSQELNNFLRFMSNEASAAWNVFGVHMPLQYLRSISKNPTQKLLPRLLFQSLLKNYSGVSVTVPKGDFFAIIKNIDKNELIQIMKKLEKIFSIDDRISSLPDDLKIFRVYNFAEHRVSFTNLVKKAWPSNESSKPQVWKLIDKLYESIHIQKFEHLEESPVFLSSDRANVVGSAFFCPIDVSSDLKDYYKSTVGLGQLSKVLSSAHGTIIMDFTIRPILDESGLNLIYKSQKNHLKRLEFLIQSSDLLLSDVERYKVIYDFLRSIDVGIYVDDPRLLRDIPYDGVYSDDILQGKVDILICDSDKINNISIMPSKYVIGRSKREGVGT